MVRPGCARFQNASESQSQVSSATAKSFKIRGRGRRRGGDLSEQPVFCVAVRRHGESAAAFEESRLVGNGRGGRVAEGAGAGRGRNRRACGSRMPPGTVEGGRCKAPAYPNFGLQVQPAWPARSDKERSWRTIRHRRAWSRAMAQSERLRDSGACAWVSALSHGAVEDSRAAIHWRRRSHVPISLGGRSSDAIAGSERRHHCRQTACGILLYPPGSTRSVRPSMLSGKQRVLFDPACAAWVDSPRNLFAVDAG